jgi:protease-4
MESSMVFHELIEAVAKASTDKAAKVLLVHVEPSTLGHAQIEELDAELGRARSRGKQVIAHFDDAENAELLLATQADRVNMTPEGMLVVSGIQAEVTFYKALLDLVGLEADFESIGKYKSAADSLTRDAISEADREQVDALVGDIYAAIVGGIAAHRKLDRAQVEAAFDRGLLTGEEAKSRRLVDTLGTWDELVRELEEKHGAAELAFPVAEPLPDISSFWGLLGLLGKKRGTEKVGPNKVALLALEGPIVMGSAEEDFFTSEAIIAVDDVLDALSEIAQDKDVKAIVVRIDSPGGSALASDILWHELRRIGKTRPVVASMGNVAASGGYYIAAAAAEIWAEPTTVTGSIGVLGGKLVWKGLMDKVGVKTTLIRRGKHAGLFSSTSRFSDTERAVLREHMQHSYDTFVQRVATGRHMSNDAVDKVAQGRVWSGKQAKEVGLVDGLGGLDEALEAAARLANLKRDKLEVQTYPKPRSLLDLLQEDRTRIGLEAPKLLERLLIPAALRGVTRLATTVGRLLERERVVAVMPFLLSIQ